MVEIVEPEGEKVFVKKGYKSEASAYHQRKDCTKLNPANGEKLVDISVANWHELSECSYCYQNGNGNRVLTADECADVRKRIIDGELIAAVVEDFPITKANLRKHVRGDCTHTVDQTPAEYSWSNQEWMKADE